MKIYKLRNKETGLYFSQLNPNYYCLGDGTAKWNKTGKTYNSPKPILHLVSERSKNKQPDDILTELLKCELVEFEIIETETLVINF